MTPAPPCILIANPDVLLRPAEACLLRAAGYQVIEAGDGRETLDLAHLHRPDLVLLDPLPGDPDGPAVCRRLKQDPQLSEIFVVLLSTPAGSAAPAEPAGGPDEIVLRPLTHPQLLACLRTCLRLKETQAALRLSQSHLRSLTDDLSWEAAVNTALAGLAAALIDPSISIQDIAVATLDAAQRLTGSEHGFVSSVDPVSGDNIGHTLTRMMAECQVTPDQRGIVFQRGPNGQYPGLWGYALNMRQAFYTNDPAAHAAAQGTPQGHIPLLNFLSVPACIGERVVGQIGLANAPAGYTGRHLQSVQRLAQLYALAVQRWQQESALYNREAQLRSLVSQSVDGIVMTDRQGLVSEWNPGMESLTGYKRSEVLGRPLWKTQFAVGLPEEQTEARARHIEQIIQQALQTGQAFWLGQMNQRPIRRADDTIRYAEGTVFPIPTEQGIILGSILHDVTHLVHAEQGLKAALAEKETLLKEVHHRVKNNLQVVTSLLSIQAQVADNPKVCEALLENKNRIRSIAAVHERLYRSHTLAEVEMDLYLDELVTDLRNVYGAGHIHIIIQSAPVVLGVDQAIPCGLIINELISNAMKYAFTGQAGAPVTGLAAPHTIHVQLERQENNVALEIADNGVGLPPGYNPYESKTLGLQLVNMLARQLRASLQVESTPGQGTRFRLVFPPQN